MLRPHFEITINDIVINNIGYLEVVSSWDTYTDTAKLMFPIKFNKDGVTITTKVESLFKRGDFVTIKSGYFPDLTTIFQGYITKINPDSPIEIEMEDEAQRQGTPIEELEQRLLDRGLVIETWSADDISPDEARIGLPGSPTKVKKIESVVLAGRDLELFEPDDAGVRALVDRLVEERTFG